jgi:hypothetical protein
MVSNIPKDPELRYCPTEATTPKTRVLKRQLVVLIARIISKQQAIPESVPYAAAKAPIRYKYIYGYEYTNEIH